MRALPLLLVVAACGAPAPAASTTPAPAPAPDPGAVKVFGSGDALVTATASAATPLHAGQPGVVHLVVDAPARAPAALDGAYQGFTPDYPMKLDVEIGNGQVASASLVAQQGVESDNVWKAKEVDYHLHVTPIAAGAVYFTAELRYSLCSADRCLAPQKTKLMWHVDVAP